VSLTAIVSQYNDPQLIMRNADDVVGGGTGGNPSDLLFEEGFDSSTDFEVINLAGWTNFSEAGALSWEGRSYSGERYANMSSFGSDDAVNIAWLITPAIAISSTGTLSFTSSTGYYVHDGLSVHLSTDYNGSDVLSATWTSLNCTLASTPPDGENYSDFISSGDIDLSAYSGQSVYIAFKYTGSAPDGTTTSFRIDDVEVAE
jgi:hypothetical protein